MKYQFLPLALCFFFCSTLNAETHFKNLPEKWKGKELIQYSDELFSNDEMYYKLIANHYVNGDFKDEYEIAELVISQIGNKDEFEEITNPLRQRKYLRQNILPKLKAWAMKTKGHIKRPEYVLYRLPHRAVEVTSIYKKLETWLAYTPYTPMHGGHLWTGKGFGFSARVVKETIGNTIHNYCSNRFSLNFPNYYLGRTSIKVNFPKGLRPSVAKVGRKKSCIFVHQSSSEDAAIDLLDLMEKGIAAYWVVKMPSSSFTTVFERKEKSGQIETTINTVGQAYVEGLLIEDSKGRPILAWTAEDDAVPITADENGQSQNQQTNIIAKEKSITESKVSNFSIFDVRAGDQINWNGTNENVIVKHKNGSQSVLLVDHVEWSKYKSTRPMVKISKSNRPMIYQGKPLRKGFLGFF